MFGIRYIKSQPTVHLIQYRNGSIVRSGIGQSLFYYAPVSTVVAIPVASIDVPFMLELVTGDFQTVTVQGQVSYRIVDAERISTLIDFSLDMSAKNYVSEDPEKLDNRVVTQAEIVIQQFIKSRRLQDVLSAAGDIAVVTQKELSEHEAFNTYALEIQSVAIQAIKPTPDIARALEAQAREANLQHADDAVYLRRIAAVKHEQSIREKELDTEIAVQEKQKQIEEARMEKEAVVASKRNELKAEQMNVDVQLEDHRKALVESEAENIRTRAEAESYRLDSMMKAFDSTDPKTLQALATIGMEPAQMIAQAFTGMADNAGKIGQLTMSPDLLQSLMSSTDNLKNNVRDNEAV